MTCSGSFLRSSVAIQEKRVTSTFWLYRPIKLAMRKLFFEKISTDKCSAEGKFLIAAIIEYTENVILERV